MITHFILLVLCILLTDPNFAVLTDILTPNSEVGESDTSHHQRTGTFTGNMCFSLHAIKKQLSYTFCNYLIIGNAT